MKIGLISDIHGDPVALELAWSHLIILGAQQIFCAGDLVGYGPSPDRAVAFLQERRITSVRGNHDRWALERSPGKADPYGGGTPNAQTLEFLATLPAHFEFADLAKVGVIVHGSPRSDMEFISRRTYPPASLRRDLAELGCDILVVGHTHEPMWYRCEQGLVVNPGSIISAPVVQTSRTFALLDTEQLSVTFHDVETGDERPVEPWSDTSM